MNETTKPKFKLIISADLESKIKRLCSKYPSVEWSGPLFYTIEEGSIEKIETLVIKAIDLFPADIGSSTFTDYDYKERVQSGLYSHIDYIDEKDYLEVRKGNIHSHNNMGVFFSGTDTQCLKDQAPFYEFYLSVIVNNKFEVKAQIAEAIELTTITKTKDRRGIITTKEVISNDIYIYDATIVTESIPVEDEIFENAIKELDSFVAKKSQIRHTFDPAKISKGYWNSEKKIWVNTVTENPNQLNIFSNNWEDSCEDPFNFSSVKTFGQILNTKSKMKDAESIIFDLFSSTDDGLTSNNLDDLLDEISPVINTNEGWNEFMDDIDQSIIVNEEYLLGEIRLLTGYGFIKNYIYTFMIEFFSNKIKDPLCISSDKKLYQKFVTEFNYQLKMN